VTLSDRDRKILLALIPLAIVAAYWFLMLAPKREEATKIQDQLTQAQSERDTAVQKAAGLAGAKRSFARDYATVIYLGKSIPSTVDMPSLLVQLDRAARGTGIKFTSIQAGERTPAGGASGTAPATTTPPPANGGTSPASSTTPAQSAPGGAAQKAGGAVNESNGAAAASGATDTTTSTTPGAPTGAAPPSNAALDTVPLDFEFDGSFFDLADFFHRMKRFVRVANKNIVVRGRLMTINSFSFDSKESFPSLTATVHATVYLAPKAEGVSAGASPTGPSGSAPTTPPAGQAASSSNPSTPAAVVTR
jgi:Tfp pilus assembly protein PilO